MAENLEEYVNPFANGPHGNCTCGWPLFRDQSCSNGECPDGGGYLDDEGDSMTLEELSKKESDA